MSRVAVLHTGEKLEFPDTTPDHVMHAAVRQRMGMPPPAPTGEQIVAEAIGALQQANEQIAAHLVALVQRVGVAVETLRATADQITVASQNIAQAASMPTEALATASKDLVASVHRVIQVGEHMTRTAQTAAATAQSAAQKTEASSARLVEALKTPRKAVKNKDGSWTAEPVS